MSIEYRYPQTPRSSGAQCVSCFRTGVKNRSFTRNKSPVSHADPIAWTVTKDEYMNYRYHVGNCLKHLLGENNDT